MKRPRNPYRQMTVLFLIGIGMLFGVAFVANVLDPSSSEERACIVKPPEQFMICVYEARNKK